MDAAFGAGAGIADEIYGHYLDDVADQLRKLAAISEFINRQPALRWSPPGEPKQRYHSGVGRQFSEEEGLQFVLAARHDHRDEPAIQAALDVYLRSIE